MNNYDKSKLISLLDSATIASILRLYGLTYKHLAIRFNITREAIHYRMKTDCWKPYEREMLLDLFVSYGMEMAELMLIHQMINKKKVL
ncbi:MULTISPECIES: hypothetical protein [Cytobacillus]|uniref:Uncharacterized protein n=1 Tax=Cytobacillus firmus TaxID=1399 RepID=A0AA46PKL6_CYTFI|nr:MULTISPECIES: hypothetical protein [Cytobacillus]MDF2039354.1 hypothetical protein [Cytobacillus oceanisediminis]UYG96748.1 hypothetical protein OD459_06880 [Cytobacillus firmus]